MKYLQDSEANILFEEAKDASTKSYSPYSNFAVGAALVTEKGNIYKGTNIENISYTGTIHAEKVAVSLAKMENDMDFKAIAVYADVDNISPCGDCRQFLLEFNKDIIVIFKSNGELIQKTVSELLPYQFNTLNN